MRQYNLFSHTSLMKQTIGVIFGGRSGEHEISIRSAKTVIEQSDPAKYDIVPLAITNEGIWLSPSASVALFPDSTRDLFHTRYGEADNQPVTLTGDASTGGLTTLIDRNAIKIDVLFPVLH